MHTLLAPEYCETRSPYNCLGKFILEKARVVKVRELERWRQRGASRGVQGAAGGGAGRAVH
jgi:hypothetical protein